ncbi:hypothetical protein GGR53DRAFT_493107 [Hypoxylon sp. FL1150]|nr:hypothetical protein GGR53DRAFT_493107 [Hypoxylon sp. FL1150]
MLDLPKSHYTIRRPPIRTLSSKGCLTGASAILYTLISRHITPLRELGIGPLGEFLAEFVSQSHKELQIFTSPNDTNVLTAAFVFAQITGRLAAVLVHVECGTHGLRNVGNLSTQTRVFAGGSTVPFPGAVAWAAMQRMAHPDGEEAMGARSCDAVGTRYDVKRASDEVRQATSWKGRRKLYCRRISGRTATPRYGSPRWSGHGIMILHAQEAGNWLLQPLCN